MKVVVTKTALKKFHKIVDYILEEWGESAAIQFEMRTETFLDLLAIAPHLGPSVNPEKKIRAFQLTSQTKVYYRIKTNRILVLTFFDVRQNPKRIKY